MTSLRALSRRAVLKAGGAALKAGGVLAAGRLLGAGAAAPALAEPATHRLGVGGQELLILSDGHLIVPTRVLARDVPEAELASFLASEGVGPQRVKFHINVALLLRGDEYVLIDAGSGGTWEPTAGRLAENLEAAGIKPEQVSQIVLTHAHPDHIWGLIDELDDSLRFPRAQYWVSAREFDFWTLGEAARLVGPIEGIAAGAKRVFKAIEAKTRRLTPGAEILPGLVAIDSAGHTPGHISLLLTSGSDKLLITADAVQNRHVAFAHPDWQPAADMDGLRAAQSRRRILDLAATDKLHVLCYHLPFPGLGRVEKKGAAFAWVADL
jgi:glyoxylase-like metal-dependent hydrolase (beta-lactamase superfamily II)